jgi:hypothetical protein
MNDLLPNSIIMLAWFIAICSFLLMGEFAFNLIKYLVNRKSSRIKRIAFDK